MLETLDRSQDALAGDAPPPPDREKCDPATLEIIRGAIRPETHASGAQLCALKPTSARRA
jgi:hypothetical protein